MDPRNERTVEARGDHGDRRRPAPIAVLAASVTAVALVAGLAVATPARASTPAAGGGGRTSGVVSPEASARWLQVDAGLLHTCAVRSDHHLFCWGVDDSGALGDGLPLKDRKRPVEVAGRTGDWAVVSAGDVHTCAIKTTGRLYCWGSGFLGRLGNGANQDHPAPVQVAGQTTDWASVSVGGSTTCGTRTNGRLYCWGGDRRGVNGDGGGIASTNVPTEVAGGADDWESVSVGFEHACARRATDQVLCWGDDVYGEVGNGAPTGSFHTAPVAVSGNGTDWASLTTSNQHTCATKTSGRLFCWGRGIDWALGNPGQDWADFSSPNEVVGASTNWARPATGYRHSCAIRTTGRLFCWGSPKRAALGQVRQFVQPTPLLVPGGFTDWSSVTAGMWSTCALRTNGVLYCWGNNEFGQAGVASTARKIVGPTRVALSV